MDAQFSHVANDYDRDFTYTAIGIYQRAQVLKEVEKIISKSNSILEINCGTGEDAHWLSERSKTVLATDISAEMVTVAREKTAAKNNISCAVLDANNITSLQPRTFDVIFSNFGGLNCLNPEELKAFLENSAKILSPIGNLALVIMGRKTIWEKLYYSLKGDRKSANRRDTSEALSVHVDGKKISTWYFSPEDISRLSSVHFNVKKVVPIGLFVPPSYMQKFFNNKGLTLRFLAFLDRFRMAQFSNYADHFLIHLEKKSP